MLGSHNIYKGKILKLHTSWLSLNPELLGARGTWTTFMLHAITIFKKAIHANLYFTSIHAKTIYFFLQHARPFRISHDAGHRPTSPSYDQQRVRLSQSLLHFCLLDDGFDTFASNPSLPTGKIPISHFEHTLSMDSKPSKSHLSITKDLFRHKLLFQVPIIYIQWTSETLVSNDQYIPWY